jgi:ligand-binding sensor domain-containing protein
MKPPKNNASKLTSAHAKQPFAVHYSLFTMALVALLVLVAHVPLAVPVQAQTPTPTATPNALVTWSEPITLTRDVTIVREGLRVSDLLAVDGLLLAATDGGVFVSRDEGQTWQGAGDGLTAANVTSLLAVGDRLYAGTNLGVFVSQDQGQTWRATAKEVSLTDVKTLLEVDGQLYAGTGEGVFISSNAGLAWRKIGEDNEVSITNVITLLEVNGRLYAGTDGQGVFVSQIGVHQWQAVNEGLANLRVWSMVAAQGRLYAGTYRGGVFISENGGQSWHAATTGLANSIVWSLLDIEGRLYAGTAGQGVFVSDDGGERWEQSGQGLPASDVWSLLDVKGLIYAATDGGGVFISEDGGNTWQGTPGVLTDSDVLTLIETEGQLYAGMFGGGVNSSFDKGLTWQERNKALSIVEVRALLKTQDGLFAGASNGLFISDDGGESWRAAKQGLPAVDIEIMLAVQDWLYLGTNAGIFVSDNGGASWRQADTGAAPISGVHTLLEFEGRLYAGTNSGVFVSENAGASWRQAGVETLSTRVDFLAESEGRLYAGSTGRVFISDTNGTMWRESKEGLPDSEIKAVLEMMGRVYAGTNEGVFVTEDGGRFWRQASDGLPASLTPIAFLTLDNRLYAGTLNGVFVSLDGGVTWQPANGPVSLHQETVEPLPLRITDLLPSGTANEAYIATQGQGVLFFTADGEVVAGSTWPTPGSRNVLALALANEDVYAATFDGLFNGPTWEPAADSRVQHTINTVTTIASTDFSLRYLFATGSLRPITIYAVTGDQTLHKSGDNGDTWETRSGQIPGLRTTRLVVGANPGVLYAATTDGIYQSLDDGQTWQAILANETVRELVNAGGGIFYAATSNGLLRTIDNWQNWTRAFSGDFSSVAVDPLDPNVVYAAARDSLLISQDGGNTWQDVPQPPGMSVDRLAIGPATPNRLWAADSQRGYVVWGTVNPGFVAPSTWPRAVGLWGGALLALGIIGLFSLSRYSTLSPSLLLQQKLMLLPVALQYSDYRHRWERSSPLGQLLLLLIPAKTGLDTDRLIHTLAQLDVPVQPDQLETELNTAHLDGLLRQRSGRYYPANAPLAQALQDHEGEAGRLALAGQIRYDHPLSANARRFFDRAGFHLIPIAEPLLYRVVTTSSAWQRLLPDRVYARFLPGETLDRGQVLAIQEQVLRIDPQASVIFAVTDRRPTESGWAQIGTLRLGDSPVTILPLDGVVLSEGLVSGHESRVLRTEVEQRLGTDYDPYDVRDPVAGAFSFFGREALVETLLRRLSEGRPVGIFGLRKLGKSSLLQALRDRAPFPAAVINLQTIGRGGSLADLYRRILRYWEQELRLKTDLEWTAPAIPDEAATAAFISAALELLDRLKAERPIARLGLFLDEVELIVPRPDGSGPDLQRYLTLLRALRGLVDEDGRLSLVVASLNSAINRINAWHGEQNPTFNLFQEINLPPLTPEACVQMVRNIGLQVGLVYEEGSLEAIAALSGGHPFLARQFCSLLYNRRNRQVGQVEPAEIPAGVRQFIFDDASVTHLDNGLWQEAGNAALWGSQVMANTNQALLRDLARADGAVPQAELLAAREADARQTALINLERYHLICQPEPDHYALQFGLLREWLRRRKLGLE